MDDKALSDLGDLYPVTPEPDPLRLLEFTTEAVKFLDPVIGHFAALCVGVAKEKRLEIEARLAGRLRELSDLFAAMETRRVNEVADRDLQFRALSTLLELAKASGDPD